MGLGAIEEWWVGKSRGGVSSDEGSISDSVFDGPLRVKDNLFRVSVLGHAGHWSHQTTK